MTERITESGWAALQDRVATLETSVRWIGDSQTQLIEQMAEVTMGQRRADIHRREQTERLDKIAQTLVDQDDKIRVNKDALDCISADVKRTNDTMSSVLTATQDLRDVVITAKTGGRLARWLAPTLVAGAVAVTTIKGWGQSVVDWLNR